MGIDSEVTEAMISAFIRWIRHRAPSATEIRVQAHPKSATNATAGYWRLCHYTGVAEEHEEAVCVLMLALACPNFEFVIPISLVVKSLKAQLELIIGIWKVDEHEPRLCRLLTRMPQGN
ncbi:hypothetical protein GGI09_001783 [Coemansia sp. S100]|nr:hypothetical protein GGI09_001783 [Coemansia sp. S100]